MKRIKQIILGIMFAAIACSANAGIFDGQTIGYQYYFPDLSSPFNDGLAGQYFVGPGGVTISPVANAPFNLSLNIQGNDITATFPETNVSWSWSDGTFNGFVISDPDLTFSSFSLVNNTALGGIPILSYDAHDLFVNWKNLAINAGTVRFTVNNNVSAVPEASTYAMWLAGLALIGFVAYRKSDSSNKPMAA